MALAGLAACGSSTKHYALKGHVIDKDIDSRFITVSHQEIPGLMPAMTMPYRLKDTAEFANVQPGDAITADLVMDAKKTGWLEKVVITDRSGRDSLPSITSDEL